MLRITRRLLGLIVGLAFVLTTAGMPMAAAMGSEGMPMVGCEQMGDPSCAHQKPTTEPGTKTPCDARMSPCGIALIQPGSAIVGRIRLVASGYPLAVSPWRAGRVDAPDPFPPKTTVSP